MRRFDAGKWMIAAALAVASGLAPAGTAHAESGRYNLHLDLGAGFPIAGEYRPQNTEFAIGPIAAASFDWQLKPPFAIEGIVGGGGFPRIDHGFFHVGVGARFRFLDNKEGYKNEATGDLDGNFFLAAHLGYLLFDRSEFGLDASVGYEWSVYKPIQVGVFARVLVGIRPNSAVDSILTFGVTASLAIRETQAVDTDHDGLSDEREQVKWHTDPNKADTDADGLQDGIEVRHDTNPTDPDSDDDGLTDGDEDKNADGDVDSGESDPRVADTDGGGVNDQWETSHRHDPRNRRDDDSDTDGVPENKDECPDTGANLEVDERGCTVLRGRIVIEGITFAFDSAEILPASGPSLERALQLLKDNPDARVEVGGHTDNQGSEAYNQRLSQQRAESVKRWLVQHGIPGSRLTTRGYGASTPRASNDSEDGRAQNRRIEFTNTNAGEAVHRGN